MKPPWDLFPPLAHLYPLARAPIHMHTHMIGYNDGSNDIMDNALDMF